MSKKFYVLSALLALGFSANAQVFEQEGGVSRQMPQNTMRVQNQSAGQESSGMNLQAYTPQLMQHLKNCQKFKDNGAIEVRGVKVNYSSEVLGRNGNICQFRLSVSTDSGNTTTACSLNPTNLAKYVEIINKAKKMKNPKKELSSQDIEDLAAIMTNEKVCNTRIVYDPMKEIRDNLTKCTPAQKVVNSASSALTFYIRGKRGSDCIFQYVLDKDLPDIRSGKENGNLIPTKVYYECKLSGYNVEELRMAFEKERIVGNAEEVMENDGGNVDELLGQYLDSGVCEITDIKQ